MNELQIIESLCILVEEQNHIIRAMSRRLCELGAVAAEDEIASANEHYRALFEDPARKGEGTPV